MADHPRIRGEHRNVVLRRVVEHGSSPHTRGALVAVRCEHERNGIIPAYAGSTRTCPPAGRPGSDHPRIRGEHRKKQVAISVNTGSSPHTRGAPYSDYQDACQARIIPAYAGSTSFHFLAFGSHSDHPRIRGEHVPTVLAAQVFWGSSPHTRGARFVETIQSGALGIIPAYAGSTSTR